MTVPIRPSYESNNFSESVRTRAVEELRGDASCLRDAGPSVPKLYTAWPLTGSTRPYELETGKLHESARILHV